MTRIDSCLANGDALNGKPLYSISIFHLSIKNGNTVIMEDYLKEN
jgi:hypothetical protein